MIPSEQRRCIVCLGEHAHHLTTRHDYRVWRCTGCGHGWAEPVPDDETLGRFYASEEAAEDQYNFPERSMRKHARRVFRWIHQAKMPPGVLLDVGCGRGVHLEVARSLGWDVIGVDNSPIARNICAARGLAIYESLSEIEKQFGETAFDVITLWETIEHSSDPVALLKQLRCLLRNQGVLALSTPNFNSIVARADYANWHELRPPMHLHYFTPESLHEALRKSGFQILNQLTYASWNAVVDRTIDKLSALVSLSPSAAFLLKVACYKFAKVYFDRTLQSKMQGLGLLSMSSPTNWTAPLRFRKNFFF
jgi:2-polyprenyl-3-methyl-5-hydroxy-6-metoxy-1,4-benzoquinol methylase